jgi:hypothetical protein
VVTNYLYIKKKRVGNRAKYGPKYRNALRTRCFYEDFWRIMDYLMGLTDRKMWIELLFRYQDRFKSGDLPGVKQQSNGRYYARYNNKSFGTYDTEIEAYMCILAYKTREKQRIYIGLGDIYNQTVI